ncbi:hypothetical protein D8I26_10720 [Enterococcus faecium]|nr:hypothetical protein [Enterococcus faecium]
MVSASSNTFLLSIIDSIKLLVKKSNNKHYILCCGNCRILSFVFLKKELKTSIVWENSKFNREKIVENYEEIFFSHFYLSILKIRS